MLMASMESGSVLPPPRYNAHEFIPPYHPCSSGVMNNITTSGEGATLSPRCSSSMKPVGSAAAPMGHTLVPSPSYPTPNSWPGFDSKGSVGLQNSSGPSNDMKSSLPMAPHEAPLKRQRKAGVYVFTSEMAVDAYSCVQQNRFDSILAWHEANCRPSTSTADESCAARLEVKRKSMDAIGRSSETVGPTTSQSPKIARSISESNTRLPSGEPMNAPIVSSSSDLLVLNDETDTNTTSDNPIRCMERMTQNSSFEPPTAKISRGASSDGDQLSRKTLDEETLERETKLSKLKTVERIMNNGYKTRVQPQCSQAQWDRMFQEQEAMKMSQSYPQQMGPGYPPQGVIGGPPPYQMPPHGIPHGVHPAFRRPQFVGPMSPQVIPPIPPSNGPIMEVMATPAMPMSQPMRPSLNPPPYSVHMTPDNYMPYEYSQSSFPSQGYSMGIPSAVSPAYSPMFPVMNGAPVPPRGYSVYSQGPRPMYPPDKMVPHEMWGQQLPQPLSNLEARVPNQKIQYHPNGAVIDENSSENINNINQLFG